MLLRAIPSISSVKAFLSPNRAILTRSAACPTPARSHPSISSSASSHQFAFGRFVRTSGSHSIMSKRAKRTRTTAAKDDAHTVGQTVRVPGLTLTDHFFTVPLDYEGGHGGAITVFARECVATDKADCDGMPYLVFLQGGPGYESPRPSEAGGWIKAACDRNFRVILLDQRGTGLSTPVSTAQLLREGDAKAQAAYLTYMRAENIVNDCEVIRKALVPGEAPWSVLGQSYGGFTGVVYLSQHPEGLREVFLTGGLPPIDEICTADTVYRHTFKRVEEQARRFYERFPEDVERAAAVVRHLVGKGGSVPLPGGGVLSVRGFQTLGLAGLGSAGGFERLHFLLERAFDGDELSLYFLRGFENSFSWDTNPIYAILHEGIYVSGPGAASRWSAERVMAEFAPRFDAERAVAEGRPVPFTGEMVFPFMFEEVEALKPLKEAADILAEKDDWSHVYDADVLAENTVPVAAATYFEDLYVEFELSKKTAESIKGARIWVTNEYLHSGVRENGAAVFERLLSMTRDTSPIR